VGELTALPQTLLAGFEGPTSKKRGGEGRERGREGRRREGRGPRVCSTLFLAPSSVCVFETFIENILVR